MSRRALPLALAAVLLVALAAGRAHAEIATIALEHRPAATVIDSLQELAPAGVGLAADGYRLIVRADAAQIAQVREAVASLDRPLANLMVTVRHTGRATSDRRRITGRGEVDEGGLSGHVEIRRTHGERGEDATRSVRTLEGHAARIDTGMTVPAGSRWLWAGSGEAGYAEQPAYRHLPDGFYAVPHVNGERVRVAIAVRRERPEHDGRTREREVVTTVSGRLGEWLVVGGVTSSEHGGSGDVRRWRTGTESARIELRVERVR